MTEVQDSQQEGHAEAVRILTTTAQPASVLTTSPVTIEWIDTMRDWARGQAAAAPPLTAEAARLICGAFAAYSSPKNLPSNKRPERRAIANAISDQSRRAG